MDLQVFGDESGWVTSKKLMEKPETFKVLEDIQNVVGVPVKFIHIISNPYDVIASSVISQPVDTHIKVSQKVIKRQCNPWVVEQMKKRAISYDLSAASVFFSYINENVQTQFLASYTQVCMIGG